MVRKALLFNALAFSALLLGACEVTPAGQGSGRTDNPVDDRLQAAIDVPPELPDGSSVELKFTLTNTSASPLYVLKWFTPLEGIAGEIFRVERGGQPLPYQGILASRVAPTRDAYVFLEPGESVSAQVDLARSYDFSLAGKYSIAFLSPRISHVAFSEAELAESLDDLGPVQIPSDPVTVNIAPAEPAGRKTLEEAAALIRQFLLGQKPDLEAGFVLSLEELPRDWPWEALRAQVFRATAGIFEGESFLIRDARVVPLGAAIGGPGLTSLRVDDLDEDGAAELLFTYGFGSGIHQSRIGMYAPAFDESRTFEAEVGYLGDLGLYKDDREGIKVRVVEADPANLRLRYLSTLGTLQIEFTDGQPALVLEVGDRLPEEIQENLVVGP